MLNIKVQVNNKKAVNLLTKIEGNLDNNVIKGVREASRKLTKFVKSRYLSGRFAFGKSALRGVLATKSGELRRSTRPLPTKKVSAGLIKGGTVIGASAKARKYVGVHVTPRPSTTIISSKKGKLAIPLAPALATGGVLRAKPRELLNAEFRGSLLGRQVGGQFIPYFIMKSFVKIDSRVHTLKIARVATPMITKTIDKYLIK